MLFSRRIIAFTISLLFCFSGMICAQSSDGLRADQMTIWRARRVLLRAMPAAAHMRISDDAIDYFNLKYSSNGKYDKVDKPRHLDLTTAETLSVKCSFVNFVKTIWGCRLNKSIGENPAYYKLAESLYWIIKSNNVDGDRTAPNPDAMRAAQYQDETILSALNRLGKYAKHPEAPLRNFQKLAAEWRAMTTKPPLPEKAHVLSLLAEDEVKKQHPSLALFYYESALEIAPVWSTGYFNAALINEELENYAQAAEHMQAYLDLEPNSTEAQTARDHIAKWKYKAEN